MENSLLLLEQYKKDLGTQGLSVQIRIDVITSGSMPIHILNVAEEVKANLIVMGARGRSMVRGLLLGSVSSAVLHNARTHVLIIRHKIMSETEGSQFEKFCSRILSRPLFPMDFSEEACWSGHVHKAAQNGNDFRSSCGHAGRNA